MNAAVDEIVARVWPDGASRWEVLGGGITNHNLKVTRPDGVFVLRVAGQDTELLGIDRRTEPARRWVPPSEATGAPGASLASASSTWSAITPPGAGRGSAGAAARG